MNALVEQKIPFLSEDMTYLIVSKVFVSPGDEVESGQGIVEVETDKANVEIASDFTGTIQSIAVSQGETVQAGDLMCTIRAQEEVRKENYSSFVSELRAKLKLDANSSFQEILLAVDRLKNKS